MKQPKIRMRWGKGEGNKQPNKSKKLWLEANNQRGAFQNALFNL